MNENLDMSTSSYNAYGYGLFGFEKIIYIVFMFLKIKGLIHMNWFLVITSSIWISVSITWLIKGLIIAFNFIGRSFFKLMDKVFLL